MFRFIHAADIHLDSPLRGLERYEGAPGERIRGATRTATEDLIDLALKGQVDFVLIAGDLYDGDWRGFLAQSLAPRATRTGSGQRSSKAKLIMPRFIGQH